MRIRLFRFPTSIYFLIGTFLITTMMAACTSSPTPQPGPTSTVPAPSPVQPSQTSTNPSATTIFWPFDKNQGQWAIVNAYRGDADHSIGGSPNDYAHLAMDFVLCFPAQVQQTQGKCTFPAGWDTGKTDGQVVYAPVKGHIRWFDAGKVNPPPSPCRSLAIELDDAPGYYIVLAHLEQLFHFNDPTKPLQLNDPVLQGEPIGKISSVSGAGCFGDAHHIHMALYYLCATCDVNNGRQAVAFSGQWSISNCSYSDDMQSTNEYKSTLVPCSGSVTPRPSPTPPNPSASPTLTHTATVSPTPVFAPPKLTVSPTNLYPGVCPPQGDAYLCTITITETSDSHGSLQWKANADGFPFSPGSGTLSPGQSVQASLAFDCHSHTITVVGPGNTITGHWSCQRIQVSPNFLSPGSSNCTMITGAYQCTVTLSESTDSPGSVSWSVHSSLNIQYSPASGTLTPGQSIQVTILFLPCQGGQITFEGLPASESIAVVNWSCP